MEKDISNKFNVFTTNNGNIIWMGTMCLAWQSFASFCEVKALEFQTNNPIAIKTINNFNSSSFSKN